MTAPPDAAPLESGRKHARAEADALVQMLGVRGPDDLDIDLIAAALDVVVIDAELVGAVGQCIVGDGVRRPLDRSAWIRVSTAVTTPARRRFTIAHELGHFWLRHVPRSVGELCATVAIDGRSARPEEHEANAFAAALLLPAAMVTRWSDDRATNLDDAREIARAFTVAIETAALRLIELTPHPWALALTRRGRVVRISRSGSFRGYVARDWSPGQESTVVECAAWGRAPRGERIVPASTWFDPHDAPAEHVIEHSIIQPGTSDVLTLLRLDDADGAGMRSRK